MLFEARFSDLIIDDHHAFLRGIPGKPGLVRVASEHDELVRTFRSLALEARNGRKNFVVEWNRTRLRVSYDQDVDGATLYVRRLGPVPAMDRLGLPPTLVDALLAASGEAGLVLICGATGAGKTTTASSLMRTAIGAFGDIGVTVEDPPEYDLAGCIGSGLCKQKEVVDNDWATPLVDALRKQPRFLLLGEVRVPEAALEALRAAVNGMTVVATIHGRSLTGGVQRLANLAGDNDAHRAMLAEGLSAVVHQKLALPGESGRRPMEVEFILSQGERRIVVSSLLRNAEFEKLRAEAGQQRLLMRQKMQEAAREKVEG